MPIPVPLSNTIRKQVSYPACEKPGKQKHRDVKDKLIETVLFSRNFEERGYRSCCPTQGPKKQRELPEYRKNEDVLDRGIVAEIKLCCRCFSTAGTYFRGRLFSHIDLSVSQTYDAATAGE